MAGTYRQAWQGRWSEHADELERLAIGAGELRDHIESLQEWCEQLAGRLHRVADWLSLQDVPAELVAELRAVAGELEVEAGETGVTDLDWFTADHLHTQLERLQYQAGTWGAGYDHF